MVLDEEESWVEKVHLAISILSLSIKHSIGDKGGAIEKSEVRQRGIEKEKNG